MDTLATPELIEVAAQAIWHQFMHRMDPGDQVSWSDASPLSRGITLAYAHNALLAVDYARELNSKLVKNQNPPHPPGEQTSPLAP